MSKRNEYKLKERTLENKIQYSISFSMTFLTDMFPFMLKSKVTNILFFKIYASILSKKHILKLLQKLNF